MPALPYHSTLKAPNLYPLIRPIEMNTKSTFMKYISEMSIETFSLSWSFEFGYRLRNEVSLSVKTFRTRELYMKIRSPLRPFILIDVFFWWKWKKNPLYTGNQQQFEWNDKSEIFIYYNASMILFPIQNVSIQGLIGLYRHCEMMGHEVGKSFNLSFTESSNTEFKCTFV